MEQYDAAEVVEERRKAERRIAPPMVHNCKVICEPVDKKLDLIWQCVKSKTSQKLFYWCVGGLAFVCFVLLGGMLWSFKDTLNDLKISAAISVAKTESLATEIRNATGSMDRRVEKLESKIEKYHNNKGGTQ